MITLVSNNVSRELQSVLSAEWILWEVYIPMTSPQCSSIYIVDPVLALCEQNIHRILSEFPVQGEVDEWVKNAGGFSEHRWECCQPDGNRWGVYNYPDGHPSVW